MKELNINILAALMVICTTLCIIALMYFTSFERHHTHDWPSEQFHSQEESITKSQITSDSPAQIEGSIVKTRNDTRQNALAYSNSKSLQHYDHKAQIVMAFLAGLGLLLTLGGLYLIGLTLKETREAAKAANATIIVTNKSHDENVSSNKRAQRAYLSYAKAYIRKFEVGSHIEIGAEIKNFGTTPATYYTGIAQFFTDTAPKKAPSGYNRTLRAFTIISPNNTRSPIYKSDFLLTHAMLTNFKIGRLSVSVETMYSFVCNVKNTGAYIRN